MLIPLMTDILAFPKSIPASFLLTESKLWGAMYSAQI